MTWLGIALLVIGVWVAIKLTGALVKCVLWVLIGAALYWFAAPVFGLPWPF